MSRYQFTAVDGGIPIVTTGEGRQLLVIDPEDIDQVSTLRHALPLNPSMSDVQAALLSLLPDSDPEPEVDEPGLWGVVEASCVHSRVRRTWVRGHRGWNDTDASSDPDDWDSLLEPEVIREGVAE